MIASCEAARRAKQLGVVGGVEIGLFISAVLDLITRVGIGVVAIIGMVNMNFMFGTGVGFEFRISGIIYKQIYYSW